MYPRTTGYLLSFPALLCVGPNSGWYQGPRMKALLHGTVIVFSSQIFLRRHCKSAPGSPTSDLRAVKQNGRRQSTGSSRGYKAPVPSYREVFCSMRLFFVCLQFRRPLSTQGTFFFLKNRRNMELVRSQKKTPFSETSEGVLLS
jgi:hypothetical protein